MRIVCRTRLCQEHYEFLKKSPLIVSTYVTNPPRGSFCQEDKCHRQAKYSINFALEVTEA
jgi:hypothetical protein